MIDIPEELINSIERYYNRLSFNGLRDAYHVIDCQDLATNGLSLNGRENSNGDNDYSNTKMTEI